MSAGRVTIGIPEGMTKAEALASLAKAAALLRQHWTTMTGMDEPGTTREE